MLFTKSILILATTALLPATLLARPDSDSSSGPSAKQSLNPQKRHARDFAPRDIVEKRKSPLRVQAFEGENQKGMKHDFHAEKAFGCIDLTNDGNFLPIPDINSLFVPDEDKQAYCMLFGSAYCKDTILLGPKRTPASAAGKEFASKAFVEGQKVTSVRCGTPVLVNSSRRSEDASHGDSIKRQAAIAFEVCTAEDAGGVCHAWQTSDVCIDIPKKMGNLKVASLQSTGDCVLYRTLADCDADKDPVGTAHLDEMRHSVKGKVKGEVSSARCKPHRY